MTIMLVVENTPDLLSFVSSLNCNVKLPFFGFHVDSALLGDLGHLLTTEKKNTDDHHRRNKHSIEVKGEIIFPRCPLVFLVGTEFVSS